MIFRLAAWTATLLALLGVVVTAVLYEPRHEDPLSLVAVLIVATGTVLAVAIVLFAGVVARAVEQAVRGLSGKDEGAPPGQTGG